MFRRRRPVEAGTAGGAGSYGTAGAGGSGWTYTESSYNTWKAGNPTDANQYLLTSNYYLTEASTLAGDSTIPAVNGGTETGHSGNGYARITRLD